MKSAQCRAGSALVLVVVVTAMLAVVGVMFVMMSRVDSIATSAISENRELLAAVDTVVERINTVLVDDLFGGDANMLNDDFGSDEYWDYPGPDDPWLANLEPVEYPINSGNYYWPHISDIYQFIGIYAWYAPASIEGTTDPNYADADGDGVTDSIWVPLPVTSSKGRPIFAAVRIIDNCGMININTAYRDPTDPCNPGANWDGSLLTHINLDTDRIHNFYAFDSYYGFVSFTDSGNLLSTAQLHQARCGGVLVPDPIYHDDVAARLLNPEFGYVPFDIGDELEFRNRFFLFSPTLTRSGMVWPVTFNPGPSNVGKQIPYAPGDDIHAWFDKVTSPAAAPAPPDRICNRRHISTTYSFDRILRPYDETPLPGDMLTTSGQRKFGIQLPANIADGSAPQAEKEQYIRQLAGAIYRGLPGDAEIAGRFGAEYSREKIAWQFAVNLIDYQDNDVIDPCNPDNPDDDEPTYYAVDDGSGLEFWGVENVECIKRDTIFISELAYVDNESEDIIGIPPIKYYAIELFNPNLAAKNLSATEDYYIVIDGGSPISLFDAGVNQFEPVPSGVVVLTNDSFNAPTAFLGRIVNDPTKIFEVTGLSFNPNDEIVVYKEDWPTSGADMPVDRTKVPTGIVVADGLVHIQERNQTLGPAAGPAADNLLWSELWDDTTGDPCTLVTAPDVTESDPNVQLYVSNEDLRTIGEIENVFAVGYDPNDHTLIGSIEESYNLGSAPELGLDMRRYGRINLADPNYWGLLDFLTCFDPSNDVDTFGNWVDNDGDPRTSNNPLADGYDNDGDGGIDNPEEGAARYYEQMVAGRININTAPWFVIKQLPWVGLTSGGGDTDNLAQAIVAWRDKLNLVSPLTPTAPNYSGPTGRSDATGLTEISEDEGFRSIGELLQVINTGALEFDIRKYLDGVNNDDTPVSPDYSLDITDDDFEERDIIFQRISNLVTVRSDVFTAYILVRVGHDGPQKRMIAIFDRSNVYSPMDRPRLVALHPVPDPR